MREVHRSQFQLGQVPIEKIWINPKSRDDIPAVLKGLQHIWSDEELRARLLALLDEHILPEADRTVGRPGMDLWQILVLGVLKQGLGCDFDRLHDLTNHHGTIREFLGHGDSDDKTRYEYQTVVDNVSLLTPELLSAVGRLVVESGHKVAKKSLGEPLRGRCDSFVVETDVTSYPTDVSLLWDATRCLLRETGRAAETVRGPRLASVAPSVPRGQETVQQGSLDAAGRSGIRSGWRRMWRAAGRWWSGRRQRSTVARPGRGGIALSRPSQASSLTPGGRLTWSGASAWRDDTSRGEGLFDFRGTHALDFQRQGGHAGRTRGSCRRYRGSVSIHPSPQGPVGGRGCGRGSPMVQEAQALYPALRACSFDRGFHSRGNRVRLDALLDVNALPGKGYLSKADREREEEESFAAARRAHPAIESAINGLEHRGLDRVRSHGADGESRGRLPCRCWRPTCIASD